ncbi:MAG: hypothetical protein IIA72_02840 [Proteobacteria bacterium]|nr:hypothetical protein [Pseudomonadota bacterium]
MKRRLILLEFNELCPDLIMKWMGAGLLPNFKKLFESSTAFITRSDHSDVTWLEPWIQWHSIHTGLRAARHGVFRLTDGPQSGDDDIWLILRRHGKAVANWGSINSKGFKAPGSIFLPDPWCQTEKAHPKELQAYAGFVSRLVQEHTRQTGGFGPRGYASLAGFLLSHGLRPGTILSIVRQLLDEKIQVPDLRWRRASILDEINFDLFRHYFSRCQPDFATFFSNSTAHYQHAYWRYMTPEAFAIKPSPHDQRSYGDAILHGYRRMDSLIGKFGRLEAAGVRLALATGLSQQPYLDAEDRGGQHYYRPKDVSRLLSELGIGCTDIEPIMTHQYMLRFPSAEVAEPVRRILAGYQLDGVSVFQADLTDSGAIYFGCWLHHDVPGDAVMTHREGREPKVFYQVLYKLDAVKSGRHHPDGMFWIQADRHQVYGEKISILDIFPTILDFFGVESAAREACEGRSMMPHVTLQ